MLKVDTTYVLVNEVHADFSLYEDAYLLEKYSAIIYETTTQIPRICIFDVCFFSNRYSKIVDADSVVYHGLKETYTPDGCNIKRNYSHGRMVSKYFYTSDGVQTNQENFQRNCVISTWLKDDSGYFILTK